MNRTPNADVAGRLPGTLPAIRFGTDGWRAVIANEYTLANLDRVAQAYASHVKAQAAGAAGDASTLR